MSGIGLLAGMKNRKTGLQEHYTIQKVDRGLKTIDTVRMEMSGKSFSQI